MERKMMKVSGVLWVCLFALALSYLCAGGLSTEERKKREKKRRKAELKAKNLQMKESKKEQGKPIENDKKLDLMAEKKDDFIPQELVAVSLFVCYGLGCLWMVVLFVFCVYCKLWSHFLID
jgi:Flp pilus assembly protein TadB